MARKQAPIITFYSFKGGVGRSMAVANVAYLLATKYRKRVLVVDWDLEAPGLHRFFDVPQETVKTGLIDLLYDYKDLLKEEHKTLPQKLFVLDSYLIQISRRSSRQGGSISLLCAGRQDKDYGKRVNEFNWEEFYEKWHGFGFMEYLKNELKSSENFDIVLLDSRTGITDIGGICTLQLPEVVVLLFALNEQNLNGIETTIQGIYSKATAATERKSPPELILRPARVERYLEQDKKSEWERQAANRLGQYLTGPDRDNPLKFMKKKSLPYIGGYGFGETPLAVSKDPDSELGTAFDDLTKSVLRTSGLWTKEDAYVRDVERDDRSFLNLLVSLRLKVYLVTLSLLLVFFAFKLWPRTRDWSDAISFFGFHFNLSAGTRFLFFTGVFGAFGGCMRSYLNLLMLREEGEPWSFMLTPWIGAIAAVVGYYFGLSIHLLVAPPEVANTGISTTGPATAGISLIIGFSAMQLIPRLTTAFLSPQQKS
jgi:hypothetical protein